MSIRFNKHEALELNGCYAKLSYDTFCQLLKNVSAGVVKTELYM